MDPLHPSARSETPVVKLYHSPHSVAMAPYMRQADRDEVRSLTGEQDMMRAIQYAASLSHPHTAKTAMRGDSVICIFGVGRSSALGVGHPWLLGTDAIEDLSIKFLRTSRIIVQEWQNEFPILSNVVDERNLIHRAWLRWLGFEQVARYSEYGLEKRPFLQFIRTAPCVSLLPELEEA